LRFPITAIQVVAAVAMLELVAAKLMELNSTWGRTAESLVKDQVNLVAVVS
jgi:hypothetical protein